MRVRFLKDRLWTPPEDRRLTVAYKAGMEETVKRAWGERMVREGAAVEIEAPPRPADEPGSPSAPKRVKATA